MRNLIRKYILNLISTYSQPSNYVHILNGHFVDELNNENSQFDFEKFIKKIIVKYEVINLDEAIILIKNKIFINKPKIVLTFDDGFEECYTIITPILNKYNLKATFFINPKCINSDIEISEFINNNLKVNLNKKFMTWDNIKKISDDGHIVGSHTYSHLILNNLNKDILEKEIVLSKKIIEEKLNIVCKYFAYPFGNDNYFDNNAFNLANTIYDYTFISGNYSTYFFKIKNVLTRRHFEPNWNFKHILYFTSFKRKYNV